MFEAVLLDRIHGCRRCTGSLPHAQVFWLGGEGLRDEPGSADPSRVLDSGSIAERLYRFKRTLDQLDLSSVRVVTTPRGRDRLAHYQKLLFTAVYTFTYQVMTGCSSPAHTDSPAEGGPEEDVMAVLRQLPALGGPIRVLTSTLIPGGFLLLPLGVATSKTFMSRRRKGTKPRRASLRSAGGQVVDFRTRGELLSRFQKLSTTLKGNTDSWRHQCAGAGDESSSRTWRRPRQRLRSRFAGGGDGTEVVLLPR